MKRLVLILGLVIILAGSLIGSIALHAGAATPSLKVTSFNGTVPGVMSVAGQNWATGTAVLLYVDAADTEHQVATAIPAANGAFTKSFPLASLDIGDHSMLAFQAPKGTAAPFVVTARQLIDEMTWDLLVDLVVNPTYGLQEIKSEVKDMLENPTYGLPEIKSEVKDLVDNTTYGLPKIKTDVADIKTKVNSSEYGLAEIKKEVQDIQDHGTIMEVYGDNYQNNNQFIAWQTIDDDAYVNPRHITITVYYTGLDNNKQGIRIGARVGLGDSAPWFNLKEIIGGTDPATGTVTLDFVAIAWDIQFINDAGKTLHVYYDVAAEGIKEPEIP